MMSKQFIPCVIVFVTLRGEVKLYICDNQNQFKFVKTQAHGQLYGRMI